MLLGSAFPDTGRLRRGSPDGAGLRPNETGAGNPVAAGTAPGPEVSLWAS